MEISKIAGGNIIPKGSFEAVNRVNDEVSPMNKKPEPLKENPMKEQEKGMRIDLQA